MKDEKLRDAVGLLLVKAKVQLDSGVDPMEVAYCFGASLCRAALVQKPSMASLVFASLAVRGLSCNEHKLGVWSVSREAHDLIRETESKICSALIQAGVAKRKD